jgi:hypothetical protein
VGDYPVFIWLWCMHYDVSTKLVATHLLPKTTLEAGLCGEFT